MHKYILDLWSSRLLWAAHRLQQACRAFKDMAAKSNQTDYNGKQRNLFYPRFNFEKQERVGKYLAHIS